jgi:hypothetical protein
VSGRLVVFRIVSSTAVGLRFFFLVALLQRFGKCMAAACANSAGLFVAKKGADDML